MATDSVTSTMAVRPVQARVPALTDDTLSTVRWQPADSVTPFTPLLDTTALRPWCTDTAAMTETVVEQPDYRMGLEPEPRPEHAGIRPGFLLLLAFMVVVMMFNLRHFGRVLRQSGTELWKVRPGRDNVFDEHPAGDTRVMLLLSLQSVVCTGILLCTAVCRVATDRFTAMTAPAVGLTIAVCAAYYLLQQLAYNVVGYTFATPAGRREWIRGFNASQSLLGLTLLVPAVLAVFYPEIAAVTVMVGFGLYIIARLLFIFKGFRIFYNKIGSLVYFILYLCTLEIIPVVFIYKFTHFLVVNAG